MIDSFRGVNRWLSNFHPAKVTYEGVEYPSVEHAYQAAKCSDPKGRAAFLSVTAAEAKALGKKTALRPGWEDEKLGVMLRLLRRKFTRGSPLAAKLVARGEEELAEGNWWGDTFWGVCKGKGENHLGKLLMQVRKELKNA